jgi:hypothetical protein
MKIVADNLYVGDWDSFLEVEHELNWAIVHATKKYHKQLLGYSGWAAPKHDPEYLYAERGFELVLNLVDPRDSAYVPVEIMNKALEFIDKHIREGKKVLIRCDMGKSRAPSIALLYMGCKGLLSFDNFIDAETAFKNDIYPQYEPGAGIRDFMIHNWKKYTSKEQNMENEKINEELAVGQPGPPPPPPPEATELPPAMPPAMPVAEIEKEPMKAPDGPPDAPTPNYTSAMDPLAELPKERVIFPDDLKDASVLPPPVPDEEIDEFESMSKGELRSYVKAYKLLIPKYKKLKPEELREAIRNYNEPEYIDPEPDKIKEEKVKGHNKTAIVKDRAEVSNLKEVIKSELSESLTAKIIITFDEACKVQPEGNLVKLMINSIRVNSNITVVNNIAPKLK